MWIALQDAAVHERARVALVAVANHVTLGRLLRAGKLPLEPGGEARAAPAAQAARLHLGDHLLRRHFGECAAKRLVPPGRGEVILEAVGVDLAAVAQHDANLRIRRLAQEVIQDATFGHRLGDDPRHVRRQHVRVRDRRRQQLHGHTRVVDAQVECAHDLHLLGQPAPLELLDERELEKLRLVADIGAGVADQDVRDRLVQLQAALARRDRVVVDETLLHHVVADDESGDFGRNLAVKDARQAGALHLDERVGKGIADGAHAQDRNGVPVFIAQAGEFTERRLGARRDPARVELDADPFLHLAVLATVSFEIGPGQRFHFFASCFLMESKMPSISEAFTRPWVLPSTTRAGDMPQQPMQRTTSRWTWWSAVV